MKKSLTAIYEEYIIREHNDKQLGSDGTVAWERKVRHLHHIAALLTTCPAGLPVQPQQALPSQSERGRQKHRQRRSARTHTEIIEHQLEVTQHMCVPLCCKRHALIPNPARAAPT